MGIFGTKDNDVRPSEASHGQNMGGDGKTRDRDTGADKRNDEADSGVKSKEFDALKARVANMEAFLKEKLEYDPKESYLKGKDKVEAASEPAKKIEAVQLPRRATVRIASDY